MKNLSHPPCDSAGSTSVPDSDRVPDAHQGIILLGWVAGAIGSHNLTPEEIDLLLNVCVEWMIHNRAPVSLPSLGWPAWRLRQVSELLVAKGLLAKGGLHYAPTEVGVPARHPRNGGAL
jgi:hypothetical protein